MAMLKDYKIPENYAERFKEVRQALSDVDRDALLKLL